MELINLISHMELLLIQMEILLFAIIIIEFKYLIQKGNLFRCLDQKEREMVNLITQEEFALIKMIIFILFVSLNCIEKDLPLKNFEICKCIHIFSRGYRKCGLYDIIEEINKSI